MIVLEPRGPILVAIALVMFWSNGCTTSDPTNGGNGGFGGTGGGAGAGGTAGEGGGGAGGAVCTGTPDIAGFYQERYNCWTDDICTDRDVLIYLLIKPDPEDNNPEDGTDYTFCETSTAGVLCAEDPPGTIKFSGRGTLVECTFTWTALSPGVFTENGTWVFSSDGQTFEKDSVYASFGGGGGTCNGVGALRADPGPPPLEGGCADPMDDM